MAFRSLYALNIFCENMEDKIFEYGIKDNFWGPVGGSGPCGPCSEIYYDVKGKSCGPNCGPNCECGRYLEFGNLELMKYNKILVFYTHLRLPTLLYL